MKRGLPFPPEMEDAFLLDATGWPPDVLDRQPVERVERFLLYKAVHNVAINGGNLF